MPVPPLESVPNTHKALYVGSKAALDAISETLRLELAPLGVRVVTCVTGIVDTNIMANAAQHELPKGSLYGAAADKIADRASGKELEGISQSSPEQFAQRLVGQVLSGATGKVYPGKLSSVAWFVGKFLPTGWLDAMITRGTGADAVAAAHVVKLEKKQ
jgi:1-acylglycerone phosphate reductase